MRSTGVERVDLNLREHLDLGIEGWKGPRESEKKSLKGKRKIGSIQSDADEGGRKVYK